MNHEVAERAAERAVKEVARVNAAKHLLAQAKKVRILI